MTDHLYVALDASGIEHSADRELAWNLPSGSGGSWQPGDEVVGAPGELLLHSASAILDLLDEQIFLAEATGDSGPLGPDGQSAGRARLLRPARWDVESAAIFGLDCVEHVLGEAGTVELSDGVSLASVITDARSAITSTGDRGERRLGFLSRLAAARRLRQRGESVGDLALGQLVGDGEAGIGGLDDPIWATLAALGDALLAALEAVRHHVLPRYVAAREGTLERIDDSEQLSQTPIFMTPWGPIVLGAEHQSPYEPAWEAARDAASRARSVARDRSGETGEAAERSWQAGRLAELLDR